MDKLTRDQLIEACLVDERKRAEAIGAQLADSHQRIAALEAQREKERDSRPVDDRFYRFGGER